jgi:hypothetical protein
MILPTLYVQKLTTLLETILFWTINNFSTTRYKQLIRILETIEDSTSWRILHNRNLWKIRTYKIEPMLWLDIISRPTWIHDLLQQTTFSLKCLPWFLSKNISYRTLRLERRTILYPYLSYRSIRSTSFENQNENWIKGLTITVIEWLPCVSYVSIPLVP